MHDSLYRNSIFLMSNTIALSIIGFVFWTIATRTYKPADIGVASTIIAATGLLASVSYLGFDYSLIKYIPHSKNLASKLNTAFTLTGIVSIIAAIAYLTIAPYTSENIAFINDSLKIIAIFILLILMTTWNGLTNIPFIALRVAQFAVLATIISGIVKIITIFLFRDYGKSGILLSHTLALTISVVVSFIFIKRISNYSFRPSLSRQEINITAKFSLANYFASIAGGIPFLVTPMVVLKYLGPEQAAYFYVVGMVVSTLNIISVATTQSLFAEASWDNKTIQKMTKRAIKIIAMLLIPSIIFMIIFGRVILSIFGDEYATYGYNFLLILSISSIPTAFNLLVGTLLRVQSLMKPIIQITMLTTLISISLCIIWLMAGKDLAYVGLSILVSQVFAALLYYRVYLKYIQNNERPNNSG